MSTFDVTLPESLKAFVDQQVALRGHHDASEFLQSLLEAERHRQVERDVERMLLVWRTGRLRTGRTKT